MYPAILQAWPGHYGQLTYYDPKRGQRQKASGWFSMANPAHAWQQALDVAQKPAYRNKALRLDVRPAKSSAAHAVQSIDLQDYVTGLAGEPTAALSPTPLPAPPPASMATELTFTPAGPPPAQPGSYPDQQGGYQFMRPMPTVQEPPANMGHYDQWLFREREQRLLEAKNEAWELREKLRISDEEKRKLKDKLDDANMEIRHKDREFKGEIKEMERKVRDEYEDREPKPSGLAGLTEVLSNPQHPLAGLLMGLAGKMLGGDAAPQAPAQLGAHSGNMAEILNAIAELLPNDEYGTKVYTALATILPRENGLLSLQEMAGLGVG